MKNDNQNQLAKQTPSELPTVIARLWAERERADKLSREACQDLDAATSKRQAAKWRKCAEIASEEFQRCEMAILLAEPSSLADLAIQVKLMADRLQTPEAASVADHAERFAATDPTPLPVKAFVLNNADYIHSRLEQTVAILGELCGEMDIPRLDISTDALRFVHSGVIDIAQELREEIEAAQAAMQKAGGAS